MTSTVFCLIAAMTIYGEARVDTMAGKRHVAAVIYNRTDPYTRNGVPFWQATIAACLKYRQFSCWNQAFEIDYESKAWEDSVMAAMEIEKKKYRPPTRATHYHHRRSKPPYWTRSMKRLKTVDSHVFYLEELR